MAEPTIGRDIAPPDLIAKVTGRAKYAEDFRADGMVFAKLLVSPMPHARVRRIDASRAMRMPGVIDILTAEDVPEVSGPGEPVLSNEPLYEGAPILAVIAEDETTAADAVEQIRIDLEPLPFVIDPLQSLRPGGPNARLLGNTFSDGDFRDFKWTADDFDRAPAGTLPMGEPMVEWSVGDLDAGFEQAALVLEETLNHQSMTHHPLEPRSSMAYWRNGRLFLHGSTQSAQRTGDWVAGALDLDPDNVVFISEYCGGGFGSKISSQPVMLISALAARKTNRPVMLRITRYEENAVGRARAGFQASVRIGFRSDGRVTALDLYIVQDAGPHGAGDYNTAASVASLAYTPQAMRFRGVSIYTNTPPRSAQRAPGGAQIISMLEPIIDKGARQLGIDRVAIRRMNAPDATSTFGPNQSTLTSAFVREALDRGAEMFRWEERSRLSAQRNGTRVTGLGIGLSPFVAGSTGFDGLLVIRPDGKLYIHQGIGNLGTHSIADTARAAADVLGVRWEQCEVVWGDTSKHLPRSSVQAGSQTTFAHTRANHAAAQDALQKLREIAARDLGGVPSEYVSADGRVYRSGNPSRGMSFAQAARRAIELGGKYSGAEFADDLHDDTKRAVRGLQGQGLVAAAKDNYPRDGQTYSFVIGFALVELDVETGHVDIKEYTAVTDCGTVLHPRSLAAQLHGGAVQGFGMARSQKWVFDPKWGVPFAKRFYTARPPGILDVPRTMDWAAVEIADPQTPVGAKGIGEPPIGAGAAAITSAIADALGGQCLCRTPLTADVILAALEGREQPNGPLEIHT